MFGEHNLESLNETNISKSPLLEDHYFIYKDCLTKNKVIIPKIYFKKDKIKIICECVDSPKIILLKDIWNYFDFSNSEINIVYKLKCEEHSGEKFYFYCEKCKQNLCNKCCFNCLDHKNMIDILSFDDKAKIKIDYIKKKINEIIGVENISKENNDSNNSNSQVKNKNNSNSNNSSKGR